MKDFFALLLIFPLLSHNLALPSTGNALNDSSVPQTPVCLDGYVAIGENCYFFYTTELTWTDALGICNSIDADLAHPLTYDENRLIVAYLMEYYRGYYGFWLGASDVLNEGTWVWQHNGQIVDYSDWGFGQPANGTDADYMRSYEHDNWAWSDMQDHYVQYFICQQR